MSFIMWLGLAFIIWIAIGVIFKTKQPIRYVGYRTGLLKPPPPPPHDYDRWDLES